MAGYIGNFPTAIPLSGTDIADGTITNSDLANSSLTVNGTTISLGGSETITAGKIGQIISAESNTETFIASTTHADTNLSATITPTSTSSKILVTISQISATDRDSSDGWIKYKVLRNTTELFGHSRLFWVEAGGVSAVKNGGFISLQFVDEPSSTSALTYKTQGAISNTANNGTARFQQSSAKSFIQLMEILA